MDVMRNLFGNLANGIIRLLVTVGILAAAYFFIVRPALDTTNKAIDSANRSFNQLPGGQSDVNNLIQQQIRQSNQQVRQAVHQAQANLNHQQGLNQGQQPTLRKQRRLLACIEHANGDVTRIQRCANRFR